VVKLDDLGAPAFSDLGDDMNSTKIAAIVLIAAGVLGLIYGGFSYTQRSQKGKIGSLELVVKEKKQVNIPIWAGVGAIAIGGVLFFVGKKNS